MAILMELDKKKPIKMAGGWLELNERDDSLSHMIRMIFFFIPQLGRGGPKMQCLASIHECINTEHLTTGGKCGQSSLVGGSD